MHIYYIIVKEIASFLRTYDFYHGNYVFASEIKKIVRKYDFSQKGIFSSKI